MRPEGYYERENERRREEIVATEMLIHRLELHDILAGNGITYSNIWT